MGKLTLVILCFVFWFLLVWPFDPVTRALNLHSLILGAVVAILVGLAFGQRLPVLGAGVVLRRIFWLAAYVPIFIGVVVAANFDVVYRVVHPDMPIRPGIVKVRTKLRSNEGRTMLANSITLTPGTLTVDVTDDGYLYVHCLYIRHEDVDQATRDIVQKYERIIGRIFE